MTKNSFAALVVPALMLSFIASFGQAQEPIVDSSFPIEPVVFVDDPFSACEGIAFNGEGRMFVTCDKALWEVSTGGDVKRVALLHSNLGLAGIGARDVLVADFGPTNAFRNGRNTDGIIWRVTPEGAKTKHAEGIGDPNFILVRADGQYLVSDDATSDIYLVDVDGNVELYTTAVNHPNGIVLSTDQSALYIAQIFTNIRPVVFDNSVWKLPLKDGEPIKDAQLVVRVDPEAAVDGLALDGSGRIYIAANGTGKIWRYDPSSDALVLIAEGMFGVASLTFGEGAFDEESIYATTTYSRGRGGKIWRIAVGAKGAPLYR